MACSAPRAARVARNGGAGDCAALTVFAQPPQESARRRRARISRSNGVTVSASYAASSALAKQSTMAHRPTFSFRPISTDGLFDHASCCARGARQSARNRLVLVAPADSRLELEIAPGFRLRSAWAPAASRWRIRTVCPRQVRQGGARKARRMERGEDKFRVARTSARRSFSSRAAKRRSHRDETDAYAEKKVRVSPLPAGYLPGDCLPRRARGASRHAAAPVFVKY